MNIRKQAFFETKTIRKYREKWKHEPLSDIEKEKEKRCLMIQPYTSTEDRDLCDTIRDIYSNIANQQKKENYLQMPLSWLESRNRIACRPDELLGTTDDAEECEFTNMILKQRQR